MLLLLHLEYKHFVETMNKVVVFGLFEQFALDFNENGSLANTRWPSWAIYVCSDNPANRILLYGDTCQSPTEKYHNTTIKYYFPHHFINNAVLTNISYRRENFTYYNFSNVYRSLDIFDLDIAHIIVGFADLFTVRNVSKLIGMHTTFTVSLSTLMWQGVLTFTIYKTLSKWFTLTERCSRVFLAFEIQAFVYRWQHGDVQLIS